MVKNVNRFWKGMFKMNNLKKTVAAVLSLALATGGVSGAGNTRIVDAAYGTGKNIVEYLNRGISAVKTGSGMLVSWRYLASDSDNAVFNLYRDGNLIYTSEAGKATCYLDKSGNASSKYRVDTVEGGSVVSSEDCYIQSGNDYFDIKLDVPKGNDCTYSPNDCSFGDVDGDGQYEIFVKWDPSNAKDNSQSGYTGNVYIDCYTLGGQKLWRIDLGKNIRAGAHYTQFLVADFDCDGYAEMTCKTADGTVDGTGKVIGDASKDYRNSSGYILSGPEYYTLFDGKTGKALDTVDYEYPRGNSLKSTWGDDYGNRVDRFLGTVAYLDGERPSAVSVRGYYTRMTAVAYDVVNDKLVKRWSFDTGTNSSAPGWGDGNHNCMPADVDGDGKQEIVLGATCLDDNGKVLWCTNLGHGDAMHLGDLLPDRSGLEVFVCHEDKNSGWGVSLIDAKDGKIVFHKDHTKDTGRCCAGNIYAENPGGEFWGATSNDIFDGTGKTIASNKPGQNFLIYWDGDLEREILDGTKISAYDGPDKISVLLNPSGVQSCNGTKSTPCLSADLFGDWREELVLATSDNNALRVFCTPYTTDYRLTTLEHDVQYRTQAATEQNCYNQPPHQSFYLGSDKSLPERPAVKLNGKGSSQTPSGPAVTTPPATDDLNTDVLYMIKNVNSGLYLDVEDGVSNVAQMTANSGADGTNTWKLVPTGDGYYYLYSQTSENMVLDVAGKKTDNGTNILIYTYKGTENQHFKLVKNNDGSYKICTRISGDKSCVEVINGLSTEGANVQQYEINGFNCQDWYFTPVENKPEQTTTQASVTTTQVPATTTQTSVTTTQAPVNTTVTSQPVVTGGYVHDFTVSGTNSSFYSITGNLSTSKGTVTYDGKTLTQCIKLESSTNIVFNATQGGKLTLVFVEPSATIKVDGTKYTANGEGVVTVDLAAGEHTVTKADTANLFYMVYSGGGAVTSVTTTTTASHEQNVVYGDINFDGEVDLTDLTYLSLYLLNDRQFDDMQLKVSDVSFDGVINVGDLAYLKQYICLDPIILGP